MQNRLIFYGYLLVSFTASCLSLNACSKLQLNKPLDPSNDQALLAAWKEADRIDLKNLPLNTATGKALVAFKISKAKETSEYHELLNSQANETRIKTTELYKQSLSAAEQAGDKLLVANALNTLGEYYFHHGQYALAIETENRLLKLREQLQTGSQQDTLRSLDVLADSYENLQDYDPLENLYKRAISILEKAHEDNNLELVSQLLKLGCFYSSKGEYKNDESICKRALALSKQQLARNENDYKAIIACAETYSHADYWTEAKKYYGKALSVLANRRIAGHSNTDDTLAEAKIYERLSHAERSPQSIKLLNKALGLTTRSVGEKDPRTAAAFENLGKAYEYDRNFAQALSNFEKSYKIRKQRLSLMHPDLADTVFEIGSCYELLDNHVKANQFDWLSIALTEESLGPSHSLLGYRIEQGPALTCQMTKDWQCYKALSAYAHTLIRRWQPVPYPPKYNL